MEVSSAAWFSGMCLADVDEMLIDVNPMKEKHTNYFMGKNGTSLIYWDCSWDLMKNNPINNMNMVNPMP